MERISSTHTIFFKRILPALWVGGLLAFVVIGFARGDPLREPSALLMPLIMVVVGLIFFRKLVWNLVDDVRDGGDYLLVRRGSVEERVRLADVMNVSINQFTNPAQLSLRLRKPGKLGDEIVFIPKSPFRWNPLARNTVAEALMVRVDRLRQAPGGNP